MNPNNSKVVNAPREKMKLHIQFILHRNKLPGRKRRFICIPAVESVPSCRMELPPCQLPGDWNLLPAPQVRAALVPSFSVWGSLQRQSRETWGGNTDPHVPCAAQSSPNLGPWHWSHHFRTTGCLSVSANIWDPGRRESVLALQCLAWLKLFTPGNACLHPVSFYNA